MYLEVSLESCSFPREDFFKVLDVVFYFFPFRRASSVRVSHAGHDFGIFRANSAYSRLQSLILPVSRVPL
jgi:hypothetical protein